MKTRPLCIAALIWVALLWLLGKAGILGFMYGSPDFPKDAKKEEALVLGTVYAIESYSNQSVFYLKQTHLIYQTNKSINSKQYPLDQIKVRLKKEKINTEVNMGDRISVYGNLEEIPVPGNPGQFNERGYYYARKIKWYLKAYDISMVQSHYHKVLWIQGIIRNVLGKKIEEAFSKEHAGIIKAMLLGDKKGMDKENVLLFQVLGCSHILAVSGLHLSILGGGFSKFLRRLYLSPPIASCVAALTMIFYGGLTGSSASVMRAVIMFVMLNGAFCLKRTYDFLSAIALAAILLLVDSPYYLYDSGFLLSFGAILGIGIVYPSLFQREKKKSRNWFLEGIKVSISVWYCILPVVLYFFCQLSLWGMFISIVIVPLSGILLLSGLFGSLLGFVFKIPAMVILTVLLKLGEIIQKLPGALYTVGQPQVFICFIYGCSAILLLVRKKRITKIIYGISLVLMLIPIPKGELTITFLDVGQGDCGCIQTAFGSTYLIDGGSTTVSNVGKYRLYPFLKAKGIRKIQGIFLSHMDADHVNGIKELLEMKKEGEIHLKIERLFLSRCLGTKEELKRLESLGREAGCKVIYLKAGDVIRDRKLKITCIAPSQIYEESNESSQVLHVSYEKFDGLFTGDVEGDGEKAALEWIKTSNISWELLKVAHHGSSHSTGEEFLRYVNPRQAVISCGKDNPYGHPHKELLYRLKKKSSQIHLTSKEGAIKIIVKSKIFS